MKGLTFNHLPKNVPIRGVSLPFSEMPRQIMGCVVSYGSRVVIACARKVKCLISEGVKPRMRARAYVAILTSVPAGTSSKSSTTSWLRMRMHPIDPGFPIPTLSGLPWM